MLDLIKSPERKSKRRKIIAVVDLYKSASSPPVGQGCLLDISIGGASIESDVVFQELNYIIINIPLSSNSRYSIGGKILRVENLPLHTFRYGIKFGDLGLMDRLELFRKVVPLLLKKKK